MGEWQPDQYSKFQAERSQPFYDLVETISPRNSMRIVDLGCGTGEHTKTLHERFRAVETLGIDRSEDMLSRAPRAPNLHFLLGDIQNFRAESEFDLLFSNAALQWVGDHAGLVARFHQAIRAGGQLAIQVPKNGDHVSHQIAYALEKEPPYHQYPGCPLAGNTLAPESYAGLLHSLGFRSIKVRLFVYLHVLPSGAEVKEWVKGSLLGHYRATQPEEVYALFEKEYGLRLDREIGAIQPYPFTFKRILMHAVR